MIKFFFTRMYTNAELLYFYVVAVVGFRVWELWSPVHGVVFVLFCAFIGAPILWFIELVLRELERRRK